MQKEITGKRHLNEEIRDIKIKYKEINKDVNNYFNDIYDYFNDYYEEINKDFDYGDIYDDYYDDYLGRKIDDRINKDKDKIDFLDKEFTLTGYELNLWGIKDKKSYKMINSITNEEQNLTIEEAYNYIINANKKINRALEELNECNDNIHIINKILRESFDFTQDKILTLEDRDIIIKKLDNKILKYEKDFKNLKELSKSYKLYVALKENQNSLKQLNYNKKVIINSLDNINTKISIIKDNMKLEIDPEDKIYKGKNSILNVINKLVDIKKIYEEEYLNSLEDKYITINRLRTMIK